MSRMYFSDSDRVSELCFGTHPLSGRAVCSPVACLLGVWGAEVPVEPRPAEATGGGAGATRPRLQKQPAAGVGPAGEGGGAPYQGLLHQVTPSAVTGTFYF